MLLIAAAKFVASVLLVALDVKVPAVALEHALLELGVNTVLLTVIVPDGVPVVNVPITDDVTVPVFGVIVRVFEPSTILMLPVLVVPAVNVPVKDAAVPGLALNVTVPITTFPVCPAMLLVKVPSPEAAVPVEPARPVL